MSSRKLGSALYQASWLGPVGLVFILALLHLTIVDRLQEQVFDLYQRVAPARYDPASPVKIVDIDDASIAKIGQWPWPRTKVAELIERLHKAGAASIAFDMVFSEPDRTSPEAFLATLPATANKAVVQAALGEVQTNDATLARVIHDAPVVLGMVLTQGKEAPDFAPPYGMASAGEKPNRFVPLFSGAVVPMPVLVEQTSGLGALNWLPDNDQIVRRVPLLLACGSRLVPGLALENLRVAQGASTFVVRASDASGDAGLRAHVGVQSVKVGAAIVGSDAAGDVRLRFTEHSSERFLAAWRILDGSVDRSEIEGRMMIVGSSSAGLSDIRATPVDAAMAGVEVQAQALEGIVSGDRLQRPDWAVLEPYFGVALAVALALALPRLPAMAGATLVVVSVGAILALSWRAFEAHQILVDPLVPSVMLIVTYLGGMSALLRAEQSDRRFVQDAFGRFVSPDVVAQLARDPSQLALGGEQRELTVMFTDLRNFSAFAERMSASDLTRFMNRYLSPMSEIILSHRGTVDKYIGDAIMAFWNAPLSDADHADHAARAALAMVEALPRLRSELAEGDDGFPLLRCGIGLASGPCVVGNLGSRLRFDYSALGDDVNLASRLESLTKMYKLDILATEATRRLVPNLAWLVVDRVIVAGRSTSTQIVTLLGDEVYSASQSFREFSAAHDAMLVVYRKGEIETAMAAIQMLRAVAPTSLSAMYDVYDETCRSNALLPPADRDMIRRLANK